MHRQTCCTLVCCQDSKTANQTIVSEQAQVGAQARAAQPRDEYVTRRQTPFLADWSSLRQVGLKGEPAQG